MTAAATRSNAARMIAGKGQSVTLTRKAAGAYDTATGSASITETTQTATAVVLPLAGFSKRGDSNAVQGDAQLLLAALTASGATLTAPVVDDTVTLADGTVAVITAVSPLAPAGTALMYDCRLRMGAA